MVDSRRVAAKRNGGLRLHANPHRSWWVLRGSNRALKSLCHNEL